MASLSQSLLGIGVSDTNPDYLNNKIRITNLVACSLLLIGLGYAIHSYFFFPALAWFPGLAIPLVLFAMVLGSQGAYHIYRIIITLTPVFITFTYHEGLLTAGSSPLPSTILLQGAFCLLPFVLFDLKEMRYILLTGSVGFISIVFFRQAEGWLEYGLDDSIYRTGFMHELTVATAMLLFYVCVYTLALLNARSEKKSAGLVQQGEEQNRELNRQREEMEQNLVRLEKAQIEEKNRAWAAQGHSRFGAIMRQNDDQQQMFDTLMAGIVKYVDANQGGLYVAEGEGQNIHLELKACYAYNRKKFQEKTIQPGQGLVGQVYLEREYIYMTEIPQGYTYITSGLGDATPGVLLIVPLITNEKVEGILELASFKPFEPYVIDFLNKLGEEIAATINISQINELTRRLLQEAQEQAEQMRAQEEEMRQNMEELQATQEEMRRKEQGYVDQIEALKKTLTQYSS